MHGRTLCDFFSSQLSQYFFGSSIAITHMHTRQITAATPMHTPQRARCRVCVDVCVCGVERRMRAFDWSMGVAGFCHAFLRSFAETYTHTHTACSPTHAACYPCICLALTHVPRLCLTDPPGWLTARRRKRYGFRNAQLTALRPSLHPDHSSTPRTCASCAACSRWYESRASHAASLVSVDTRFPFFS